MLELLKAKKMLHKNNFKFSRRTWYGVCIENFLITALGEESSPTSSWVDWQSKFMNVNKRKKQLVLILMKIVIGIPTSLLRFPFFSLVFSDAILSCLFEQKRDANSFESIFCISATNLNCSIAPFFLNMKSFVSSVPSNNLYAYKKTSTFISNVLTGYFNSNFSNTVGCSIPKTPMTFSLPAIRTLILAA